MAYFNRSLYLRNLKRFWPLAAAILLISFFTFIGTEIGARGFRTSYSQNYRIDLMPQLMMYCSVFVPIFSILTGIAVFGYLHKPKASGFISSLPVSRLCLYVTNWISGLTIMLAPVLFIGVLYGGLLIGLPIEPGHYLIWIGMMLAAHLIFFSLAVFVTFLTGNSIMQVFLFGLINFVSILLFVVFMFIVETLVFGYSGDFFMTDIIPALMMTPPVAIWMMISAISSGGIPEISTILLWVGYPIFTALMIFFGYKLYLKRKIESAGNIIVHKTLRSIFKYLIGFLMGALLGFTFTEILNSGNSLSMPEFVVTLTISAAFFGSLGCLFSEMLIRKSLRVWKTAYKGIIAFSVAVVALMLFIRFDISGYERRVPDFNSIAAVSVAPRINNNIDVLIFGREPNNTTYYGRSSWTLTTQYAARNPDPSTWSDEVLDEIKMRTYNYYESHEAILAALELHDSIIKDKRRLESRNINQYSYTSEDTYIMSYKLKNGRTITREYKISDKLLPELDVAELILALYGQSEAVEKRNRFTSIPDSAVVWADLTRLDSFIDSRYVLRSGDNDADYGIIPEDAQPVILEAMRRDVEAGTLGYIDMTGNYSYFFSRSLTLSKKPETFIIDLIYDTTAAGVPTAFQPDTTRRSSGSIRGLSQTIIITEYNVNTMQAIRELDLFG